MSVNVGPITTKGYPAKTVFLAREIDRLSIEFQVAASQTLYKGHPVKLDVDGKIKAWVQADGIVKLIGYVMADAVAGDLVTVFTRGFAIILGIIKSNSTNCGVCGWDSYDTTTAVSYPGSGMDTQKGYHVYDNKEADAPTTKGHAWLLDAGNAGDLARVMLMN